MQFVTFKRPSKMNDETDANRHLEIDAFYREHYTSVLKFCAGWLKRSINCPEVKDAASEAMLRAVKAWDRFDSSRASRKTWVITMARNAMIDRYRKARNSGEVLTGDVATVEKYSPKAGQAQPRNYELLRSVLKHAESHEDVKLQYFIPWFMQFMGFTVREIGAILGVSRQSVCDRVRHFTDHLGPFVRDE